MARRHVEKHGYHVKMALGTAYTRPRSTIIHYVVMLNEHTIAGGFGTYEAAQAYIRRLKTNGK